MRQKSSFEGGWYKTSQAVSDAVRNFFTTAQRWRPRRDPLTLDLDNDGIETVAASSTKPILFDYDGDGIKTGTGWIGPDDGFLALDRNGNGVIDNGTELFGDDTPVTVTLPNGSTATGKAADGFIALKAEDTNLDGKVDSADANWKKLRVWRDLNQDGISQSNELFTLNALGISAINVAKIANSQTLPNGNQIADLGSFTRTDGSQGMMGEVDQMADVNLFDDTFHRAFPDHVPLVDGVAELPEMQGSGKVRDLHEAASQSAELKDLLAQFSQAATRQTQRALLDRIMSAWSDTSGMIGSLQQRANPNSDPMGYQVSYQRFGDIKVNDYLVQTSSSSTVRPEWNNVIVPEWEKRIHILEAFNGRYFFKLPNEAGAQDAGGAGMSVSGSGVAAGPQLTVMFTQQQIDLLDQSYDELKESIYSSLALQTRLKPLFDKIGLVIDADGIRLDHSALDQYFLDRIAADKAEGLGDLVEFNRAAGNMLSGTGWHGGELAASIVEGTSDASGLHDLYTDLGIFFSAKNHGSSGNDFIVGQNAGDKIETKEGDDAILGGGGDDRIYAGAGEDVVYGDAGNDVLWGDDGGDDSGDVLYGSDGNDTLSGGNGDDLLEGGVGNDSLIGGASNDTYLVRIGSGQDIIYTWDTGTGRVDTLQFADVAATGLTAIKRVGDNLILEYGSSDRVTVQNHFMDDGYGITRIQFSDGKVLTPAQLFRLYPIQLTGWADKTSFGSAPDVVRAGGGNDTINAGAGDDTVYGEADDDVLNGEDGGDVLYGGDGADTLIGGAGDDLLESGAGNDSLMGGAGNDTYLMRTGSGQDIIYTWDTDTGRVDTLQFADVASTGLMAVRRVGYDMVLEYGASDRVTVVNQFTGGGYDISQIQFSDGKVLTPAQLFRLYPIQLTDSAENTSFGSASETIRAGAGDDSIYADAGDDIVYGEAGGDVLWGQDGGDVLYGDDGDDTLIGGNGDDLLEGGAGSDTYLFNVGDGQDRIDNTESDNAASIDTLLLGADVTTANITLNRSSDDLIVRLNASDNITVKNYFLASSDQKIDRIQFDDGTIWDQAMLEQHVSAPTTGADKLTGGQDNDTIHGLDGDDTISGGAGSDQLFGDAGSDTLNGDAGSDTLDGGTGSDKMAGGSGDDVYMVDSTSDTIVENANEGIDTVKSSVTLTLGSNVENLTLTGSAAINGTGNALNNVLTGNSGTNTLKGGTGTDTMSGGAGDDIYVVDNTSDVVIENVNEGADLVQSSVTYTLSANVENLTLTGTSTINGTGNASDNVLTGNSAANTLTGGGGNDTLDGGSGADKLAGGAGNDTYIVDNTGDAVTENANEGIDLVKSSVMHTLAANVEALMLTGTGIINGTGNTLDNLIAGNGSANVLNGSGGSDLLQGAGGNDTLTDTSGNNFFDGGVGTDSITGGTGNDFFAGNAGNDTITTGTGADVIAFNRSDGQDVVNASTGKDNTLSLGKGIKYADLQFKKSSNDLVLVTGTNEQITFKDWYLNTNNHSVANLQIVIEGTTDYNAASSNSMNNKKIERFNFDGLVTAFDQARAANSSLTSWALSSSLLKFYLAGSDTAAIGGDLAYQYAHNGNWSTMSMAPTQTLLASAQFGTANQNLQQSGALQDASPRLM